MTTPSISRRAPMHATVASVHGVVALVYMLVFSARYGYSPLIVPLHLLQLVVAGAALWLVTRVIAARVAPSAPGLARVLVTLIGALASSIYLLVLIGCAVTNEAWGWSVSLQLAREYASSLGAIVGNLPFSRRWLYAGAALFLFAELGIIAGWWFASSRLASPSTPRARSTRSSTARERASFMVPPSLRSLAPWALCIVAMAFILIARTMPSAAPEPFTALLTPPGLANPAEARARNAAARRAYVAPATFDRRNVIIIFSDALRADHTSLYGYQRHTTPFLQRLADAGQLRQVRLALSTCSFTACGVLSTLASRDTGVLEPGSLKLHDILHDLGYRVNIIASTDNSSWYTLRLHYGETVDYFFDGFNSTHFALNDDRSIIEGLEAVPNATAPSFFMFFLSSTASLGNKLPRFRAWLPAEADVSPKGGGVQAMMNAYDNGILQADDTIEQIFALLDSKGYLQHSIVVILGDHGEGFGEHGHFAHTKYLYQEVLRIPLLIYDDSSTRYRNMEFATQSDIVPTLLDRLGLPVPAGWQGRSLLTQEPKSFSTHWTDRSRPWHAVVYRNGGKIWKYLYQTRWGSLTEEVYELTSDPSERVNLMAAGSPPADVLTAVRAHAQATFGSSPQ